MARRTLHVEIELERIICHDEGDGWGSAEPYLWTVFFKVDGDMVYVTDSLELGGQATIETTPGSHGNLGVSDVDEGDEFSVPSAIGYWRTFLKPIPTPESVQSLAEDVGGVVGVIAILMEEDNVSDDGAEAGHQALNNAVRDAINQIIATRSFTNQEITQEDIDGLADDVRSAISSAIQNQQNFFENIWSWLNADDSIGDRIWFFTHDEIADGGTIEFSNRWRNEGDWEIFGHITSTPLCPANALDDLFAQRMSSLAMMSDGTQSNRQYVDPNDSTKLCQEDAPALKAKSKRSSKEFFDLKTLRKFRDGAYAEHPGLAQWWKLMRRNTPSIIRQLLVDPNLRQCVKQVMEYLPAALNNPNGKLSSDHLDLVEKALIILQENTRNRRLAIDCSRAREAIPLIRGHKVGQVFEILNNLQPARHPVTRDNAKLRLSRPARD